MSDIPSSDSPLRVQAAFEILRQLITELSGSGDPPTDAAEHLREYDRESPSRTTGPDNPYEMNLDFQREVVDRLVSPGTAHAYEESAWFQSLGAPDRERKQKEIKAARKAAAARRQADEAQQRAAGGAAMDAASPSWVKTDVAKAGSAKVDLSVFGLELGRALTLPKCAEDETAAMKRVLAERLSMGTSKAARGGPETCTGDFAGETMSLLAPLAGAQALGGDQAAIRGAEQVGVGLAKGKCPAWLSTCSVSVSVLHGVMIGVSVPPGDLQIAAQELTRKYGKADGSRHLRCTYSTSSTVYANGATAVVPTGTRTVEGTALTWSKLPGIYVSYTPYTGTGCHSELYVELASVHASGNAAAARATANEPKM